MYGWVWTLNLLFFSVYEAYCACPPLIDPIHVDVRNITLPNQYQKRGLAIQIGNPPQNLAFQPSNFWNNSFVYDASTLCDKDLTLVQCNAQHGGFYDSGSSTTWRAAKTAKSLGVPQEASDDSIWGTDEISFNSSFNISEYPFGIQRDKPIQAFSLIGLGKNSTFINALFDAGAIASKTWGLAWGWSGVETSQQIDGGFVMGGYDAAKILGKNVTSPLTPTKECPSGMLITINGISMNLKNGSNPSILGSDHGSAFRACLETATPLITIPGDVFQKFVSIGGGTFVNRSEGTVFWGMDFLANDIYDGDLTFDLANDVSITIPNHQLVLPDFSVNARGQNDIQNSSLRELMLYSLESVNQDDLPLLGQVFLSAAYLTVDLDHQEFSLSSYNATTEQKLVSLGPRNCASTPPQVPASNTTVGTPTNNLANEARRPKNRLGMIIGVVIGSIAFILLMLAAFMWRKRRLNRRALPTDTKPHTDGSPSDGVTSNPYFANPELPADRQPPQEMPLEKHQPYSMAPYEMAADKNTPYELPGRTTPRIGPYLRS